MSVTKKKSSLHPIKKLEKSPKAIINFEFRNSSRFNSFWNSSVFLLFSSEMYFDIKNIAGNVRLSYPHSKPAVNSWHFVIHSSKKGVHFSHQYRVCERGSKNVISLKRIFLSIKNISYKITENSLIKILWEIEASNLKILLILYIIILCKNHLENCQIKKNQFSLKIQKKNI